MNARVTSAISSVISVRRDDNHPVPELRATAHSLKWSYACRRSRFGFRSVRVAPNSPLCAILIAADRTFIVQSEMRRTGAMNIQSQRVGGLFEI